MNPCILIFAFPFLTSPFQPYATTPHGGVPNTHSSIRLSLVHCDDLLGSVK